MYPIKRIYLAIIHTNLLYMCDSTPKLICKGCVSTIDISTTLHYHQDIQHF